MRLGLDPLAVLQWPEPLYHAVMLVANGLDPAQIIADLDQQMGSLASLLGQGDAEW